MDVRGLEDDRNLALVGPYALAVAVPVVQFLGSIASDLAKDVAKNVAKPVVGDLVRRMFTRSSESVLPAQGAPVVLSRAQVLQVRDSSYANALAAGLPETQAQRLADAMVGSLNGSL